MPGIGHGVEERLEARRATAVLGRSAMLTVNIARIFGSGFAIPDRGTPDIRRHQVGSHKPHGHPAEKPEGLMRWIIETSAVDGTVLDPFTGSGSTLAAARSLGIPAAGIEAEERWCEVAARRCSQQTLDFGGVA